MYYKILLGVLIAFFTASCNQSSQQIKDHNNQDGHDHSESIERQDEHEEPSHRKVAENQEENEEIKFQYTSYSSEFELFAEADAFVVGEKANVLSHFSTLPDFKAVVQGKITIILTVNGKETRQTLSEPTRKGIYSFDIHPETQGRGNLIFEITNDKGTFEVLVPELTVFANATEARKAAESIVVSQTNTTVFTKEQSWKIEFATALPTSEPFGQVIKTTALVQSAQSSEMVITAETNGIVLFNSGILLEGRDVNIGQPLFTLTGSNLADNNINIKYSEARSNYEKANADYERAKELAKDKIVSEKDLLTAKIQYENSKAIFDNLNKNFNASGQSIRSPQSGFLKQVYVKNGAYVESGQPIAVVSQNKSLLLHAEVPSKYASILANIKTAHIKEIINNQSFTLEELNGKVLSFGKAANSDNYLIPVALQVENNGSFISGNFVEIYLKTYSNNIAIVIPTRSLLEEQGSYFVWVQITPELFEKREVFVGGSDGINTEIRKGILANERIVTRGSMLIKLAQATGTLDAHSGHVH